MKRVASFKNQKVAKTNRKILLAMKEKIRLKFCTFGLRTVDVCKRAGISRTTFYRHFSSIDEAYLVSEAKVMDEWKNFLAEGPDLDVESRVVKFLTLILRNKTLFGVNVLMENVRNLTEMVELLYGEQKFKNKYEKRVQIYGVVAIVMEWGQEDFNREDFNEVFNRILRLVAIKNSTK